MERYLFSKFREGEIEALHNNLSKVLDVSKDELCSIYAKMREEFQVDGYPQCMLARDIFRSDDKKFQKHYDEALVIGVDIPSLFERDNGSLNKKTVVILGQDPLRSCKEKVNRIEVGTPYGLHLKNCREVLRNTSLYFDLIKFILDKGYRVYLTDIIKIWVSQPKVDRGIPLSNIDRNRFIKILKAELEIFEPIAVISWGRIASNVARNDLGIQPHDFPHPSGAANGKWREIMGKPATRENRINFWQEEISKFL
jgi:hypothetical protein